jgi:hypothetical protein
MSPSRNENALAPDGVGSAELQHRRLDRLRIASTGRELNSLAQRSA